MTPHAIIEYVKYRWKAKDRHGIHSPFAYDLSEKVLSKRSDASPSGKHTKETWLPAKYLRLLHNVTAYYQYNNLYFVSTDEPSEIPFQDMLLFKSDKPGNWVRHFNKYLSRLSENGAVLIAGIHNSKRHSAKWQRLHNHPKVFMSVDLYGVGILFFKKEFKEKQHFILKY